MQSVLTQQQPVVQLNLGNLLASLSVALDFTRHGLVHHHRRVAHIALEIGRRMELDNEVLKQLYCAALIHDIGAISLGEKTALTEFEIQQPFDHCARGQAFVTGMPIFAPLGEIIASHHDRWQGANPSGLSGDAIPLASRIIHLADRLDVVLHKGGGRVLDLRHDLLTRLREQAGRSFDPILVQVLEEVAAPVSFWLDLYADFLPDLLSMRTVNLLDTPMDTEELLGIARLFSRVIDARSAFTYRHSKLVTRAAVQLARRLGFAEPELVSMEVAGLLHDLGKLSVAEEILEKPGKLSAEEYHVIQRHTYYTFHILRLVDGFQTIREWAAYHHERLGGGGYPFNLDAPRLSVGSRVVAVADVFAALAEDRPYRTGMARSSVERIMRQQVKNGALDGDLVELLLAEYDDYEALKHLVPGTTPAP